MNTFLSLGDHVNSTALDTNYFDIGGLNSGHLEIDATEDIHSSFRGKYKLVWSERMLEHIPTDLVSQCVKNISNLLDLEGILRFSLPICYFVDGHMLREGNFQRQLEYGHRTWFNIESYGEITEEIFGRNFPLPKNSRSWDQIISKHNLFHRPIRYYGRDGSLYVDDKIFDEANNQFLDFPKIKQKRPNSFIFDLSLNPF
jgi:hypothetical protein